jgi:hypothetical protein
MVEQPSGDLPMDRDEIAQKSRAGPYANNAEVNETDAPDLLGITGREDDLGADPASDSKLDIDQPVGAVPRSTITGRHDSGTGANETLDGLSGTEEATRRAAEDETEADDVEDLPVFDRAEAMPKII